MSSILLQFFLILITLININCNKGLNTLAYQQVLRKQKQLLTKEMLIVKDVLNLNYYHPDHPFKCGKKVETIFVQQKTLLNCKEEYVKVAFETPAENGTLVKFVAYLTPLSTLCKDQLINNDKKFCKKIKR